MSEPVAGGGCVSELCGGAGGVRDIGKPGRGRNDGRLRADATAFCGDFSRSGVSRGSAVADAGFRECHDGGGTERGADGGADGGFAIHSEHADVATKERDGVGAEHTGG